MEIAKSGSVYSVTIHSIDETDVPIVTNEVTIKGNAVTVKFDMNTDPWIDYHRVWKAQLSADGTTLAGPWTGFNANRSIPTTYQRVAKATWPVVVPTSSMVNVDGDVRDEVLDWGGTGRPVVLLAGLGNTGHDFFAIIPALKSKYHVYSITRRGFGNSDKPVPTSTNYTVSRLGDDVLAVMSKLDIKKPVLIGHSIAGEELSYIGMNHAADVSGLIYLDAGYWYAFDSGIPNPFLAMTPGPHDPPMPPIGKAVLDGMASQKSPIDTPILAIFAHPKLHQSAKENDQQAIQIAGFEKGLPNAHVIKIAHADHFVYMSNTAEVLRDINAFIERLP